MALLLAAPSSAKQRLPRAVHDAHADRNAPAHALRHHAELLELLKAALREFDLVRGLAETDLDIEPADADAAALVARLTSRATGALPTSSVAILRFLATIDGRQRSAGASEPY